MIYHTGGERTNLQPTIYHTGGERTNLHHQCGQKQENLVYTWKKLLQHPNFFLLTKLWDASILLLAEMLQIESFAHRKTHFTIKNLMLYNS
jgi:hypothetical protein